jgi:hypothetical protein
MDEMWGKHWTYYEKDVLASLRAPAIQLIGKNVFALTANYLVNARTVLAIHDTIA